MNEKHKSLLHRLFVPLPAELADDFKLHCSQKNNFRFSILPAFNILTQVSCYFIYLYIYPATFPDKIHLDPLLFSLFSLVYVAANLVFLVLFMRRRRAEESLANAAASHILLVIFLVSYILFESFETILEVEISGNIYRFLATFFMVAFLPILRRREKFTLLTLFIICVELGFSYVVRHGYSSSNRFGEIALLFFFVCLAVSAISYNASIRNFSMHHDLIMLNEELRLANERLAQLAVLDPLTQISNRRAFNQYVNLAWRSAYQDGRNLTITMVDIDDFKEYNDTYGHQKGDDCLALVAGCLRASFQRESDMVARYGGEEFVILSVQDDVEHVGSLVEAMLERIRQLGIEHRLSSTGSVVTVSAGLACAVPSSNSNYEELLKRADDALYQAKRAGKNCLRIS